MPANYPNILNDFLNGTFDYLPTSDFSDIRVIRGVRSLLEMPFLHIKDPSILIEELKKVAQQGYLSEGAKEQFIKMVRNARFEGAHNRFSTSIPGVFSEDDINLLVRQISQTHKNAKNLPLVPEFTRNEKIEHRKLLENDPFKDILIPWEEFKVTYTNNGILYHGTPDIMNVLSMIRNGLVVSNNIQGTAAFGLGFYTTRNPAQASEYGTDKGGIVLSFKVREGVRVVELEKLKNSKIFKDMKEDTSNANKSDDDIIKTITQKYHIDILIAAEHLYPLIQNSGALILPKNLKNLIELQFQELQQAQYSIKDKKCQLDMDVINNTAHLIEHLNELAHTTGMERFPVERSLASLLKKVLNKNPDIEVLNINIRETKNEEDLDFTKFDSLKQVNFSGAKNSALGKITLNDLDTLIFGSDVLVKALHLNSAKTLRIWDSSQIISVDNTPMINTVFINDYKSNKELDKLFQKLENLNITLRGNNILSMNLNPKNLMISSLENSHLNLTLGNAVEEVYIDNVILKKFLINPSVKKFNVYSDQNFKSDPCTLDFSQAADLENLSILSNIKIALGNNPNLHYFTAQCHDIELKGELNLPNDINVDVTIGFGKDKVSLKTKEKLIEYLQGHKIND